MFVSCIFITLICGLLSTANATHILVIAPPFLSHMIPSLELAKQLSSYCHVTFLTSIYRINEFERKGFISDLNSSKTLDIVGLVDGNNHFPGLTIEESQISSNNTAQIAFDNDQRILFNEVLVRMGKALHHLFQTDLQSSVRLPIDMIIARSFVPLSFLNASIPIHLFLPSNLRGVINYMRSQHTDKTGQLKEAYDYVRENIHQANGFICNSLKEFDGKYVEEFYQSSGNLAPIRFIGPLVFNNEQSRMTSQTRNIIDWLDKQPIGSVIYIAFGSIANLPTNVIDSVACALKHHSFIWSLKTKSALPPSLHNLDSDHQLIVDWAPQRAILSHISVAFFFSHGGWNSLLESMIHGKVLLVWPFFADQFDNALQVVDMGVGRQVSYNLTDDIQHMLLNGSYAKRAKEVQELVIDARENTSKKQILDIVRLISKNQHEYDEL
ncbi:unnamed protein product [Adineta ricciae]|uniref:Uncharacterized protein n=1 Tax=Adineta ricciae TaxID=249248 RepID=A0A814DFJ1_ADIRI|nr:unnamed protein product [Adineta ricciae]CAF1377013.1 unnamed protein product [Adineta ricciae]